MSFFLKSLLVLNKEEICCEIISNQTVRGTELVPQQPEESVVNRGALVVGEASKGYPSIKAVAMWKEEVWAACRIQHTVERESWWMEELYRIEGIYCHQRNDD